MSMARETWCHTDDALQVMLRSTGIPEEHWRGVLSILRIVEQMAYAEGQRVLHQRRLDDLQRRPAP